MPGLRHLERKIEEKLLHSRSGSSRGVRVQIVMVAFIRPFICHPHKLLDSLVKTRYLPPIQGINPCRHVHMNGFTIMDCGLWCDSNGKWRARFVMLKKSKRIFPNNKHRHSFRYM